MKIIRNPSLTAYNTFHLPISAREMVILENSADYVEIFHKYDLKHQKYLIIGEGSNILFKENFNGLIITSAMDQVNMLGLNESHAWIEAEAGLNWHKFVLETIAMGYQGLENLSLIPGKVGAAPMQNIGAYGVEIEQFIDSVVAVDIPSQETVIFSREECRFGYRTSIFKTTYKGQVMIRSIRLRLNRIPEYNITYDKIRETLDKLGIEELSASSISQAVIRIRQDKLPDPDKIGNAGSFFKNPVVDRMDFEGLKAEFPHIVGFNVGTDAIKVPAAWLIEQCGWKGRRINGAGVHEQHSLVLVNYGEATGKEIFELSKKIQRSVARKFGILLETEVNII
ncbi:MAG: UDP-N-acetylmuramate dehydrogenase [Cyclobacteriaceae bacterium]|nr:UDP-N-acetylmuramate dehydrogenase [Cyclobacteriaceae bacterium]